MPVEPALREARMWLRSLTRAAIEAEHKRLSVLVEAAAKALGSADGKDVARARGPGGDVPAPKDRGKALPEGAHPYDHPYYWAAFVCVGSPE
jgi:CHAT domain-containing protein